MVKQVQTTYVTLVHPKVPGQRIQVHPDAVAHHERGGWRREDAPDEPVSTESTESKRKSKPKPAE